MFDCDLITLLDELKEMEFDLFFVVRNFCYDLLKLSFWMRETSVIFSGEKKECNLAFGEGFTAGMISSLAFGIGFLKLLKVVCNMGL